MASHGPQPAPGRPAATMNRIRRNRMNRLRASGQPGGAAKQSPGQPPADKSQVAGQPQQGSSGSDATPRDRQNSREASPSRARPGPASRKNRDRARADNPARGSRTRAAAVRPAVRIPRAPAKSSHLPAAASRGQPGTAIAQHEPESGGAPGRRRRRSKRRRETGRRPGRKTTRQRQARRHEPRRPGFRRGEESGQGDLAQRRATNENRRSNRASGYDPARRHQIQTGCRRNGRCGAQGESAHGGPSPSVPKTPTDEFVRKRSGPAAGRWRAQFRRTSRRRCGR